MSLVFYDGFEHTVGTIEGPESIPVGPDGWDDGSDYGERTTVVRAGTGVQSLLQSTGLNLLRKTVPADDVLIIGFAWKPRSTTTLGHASPGNYFAQVLAADGTTVVARLRLTPGDVAGNRRLAIDVGGTQVVQAPSDLPSDSWRYTEVKFDFGIGTIQVRMDETVNADTAGVTFPAQGRIVQMAAPSDTNQRLLLDDIYIVNSDVSDGIVNYLGDVRILRAAIPTSGVTPTFAEWVTTAGNYNALRFTNPSTDTDRQAVADVLGQRISVHSADVSAPGGDIEVLSVSVASILWNQGGTPLPVRGLVVDGAGVGHSSPSVVVPSSNKRMAMFRFDNDPSTAAPWELANVNAYEIGLVAEA